MSSNNFSSLEPENIFIRSSRWESKCDCRFSSRELNLESSAISSRKLKSESNWFAWANENCRHSSLRVTFLRFESNGINSETWASYLMQRLMIAPQSKAGNLGAWERHLKIVCTVLTCEITPGWISENSENKRI